ncbi:MAG TPA: hypothetical protein VKQ30_01155 [Ktedonobacterales bacterium]|nr:hypothetical protein [Ktedonobacterales bacterium]
MQSWTLISVLVVGLGSGCLLGVVGWLAVLLLMARMVSRTARSLTGQK